MPDNGALERLSKKLNAGHTEETPHRSDLFPRGSAAPSGWQAVETEPIVLPMAQKSRFNIFSVFFAGSVAFFLIAIAIAAFLFFSGTNTISTKNVDVQVSGPSQIDAGSTLSLQVVVTNRNPVPIQLTDLVVEFPQGTRSDINIAVATPRTRISLGTINPGESVSRTVKAVLFGQAGTQPEIQVSVEYHTPSSNAIFSSGTTYTTHIGQSPASIVVSSESQVVSGQATPITVTITSNSPQTLSDMLLAATYPPGFSLQNANPAPASGTTIWNLGDIEPGGVRTITLNGIFTGEDGDQRTLTFEAGSQQSGSNFEISAPLATAEADTTVAKPFISAAIALDNSIADQHTIVRGKGINAQVAWTNNLPTAVQNLVITLSLKGKILDRTSVRVPQGFFNSSNSSIVWDKTTFPNFAAVAPGQSGILSFSFATLPLAQGKFQNPELDLAVTVHANRFTEGNVPGTVDSSASTKALVATDFALTTSLSHVGNAGPLPPKADKETGYTVSWSLSNTANAAANSVVTAALPTYAKFIGAVLPTSETVTFDSNQRIVTWNVGDITAGQARAVSFTVGITPSVSQVGQVPVVITDQKAAGFDRFVQDNVSATARDLTTGSAATSQDQGVVVP